MELIQIDIAGGDFFLEVPARISDRLPDEYSGTPLSLYPLPEVGPAQLKSPEHSVTPDNPETAEKPPRTPKQAAGWSGWRARTAGWCE